MFSSFGLVEDLIKGEQFFDHFLPRNTNYVFLIYSAVWPETKSSSVGKSVISHETFDSIFGQGMVG
jgi:hypothetical protein